MKALFLVLLALNLGVGAWLLANGPADLVREPARMGLQVLPDQFRLLTDAELARRRSQSEQAASALASAAASAPVAAPTTPAGPDLPLADCGWIGGFASEVAARKLYSRLVEAGIGNKVAIAIDAENQKGRLHVTGMDPAAEERVHEVLREFPRLSFEHCVGAAH